MNSLTSNIHVEKGGDIFCSLSFKSVLRGNKLYKWSLFRQCKYSSLWSACLNLALLSIHTEQKGQLERTRNAYGQKKTCESSRMFQKHCVVMLVLVLCVFHPSSRSHRSDEIPKPTAEIKLPTPAEPLGLTPIRRHDNGTPR